MKTKLVRMYRPNNQGKPVYSLEPAPVLADPLDPLFPAETQEALKRIDAMHQSQPDAMRKA